MSNSYYYLSHHFICITDTRFSELTHAVHSMNSLLNSLL